MSRIVRLQALVFNESSGKCHKNLTQIPSWHHFSLSGYCDYLILIFLFLLFSGWNMHRYELREEMQTDLFN